MGEMMELTLKIAKSPSNSFAGGYVPMHIAIHSQTPELFNSVSAYTTMSLVSITFLFWSLTPGVLGYLASPRFWPLLKFWPFLSIHGHKSCQTSNSNQQSLALATYTSLDHRQMYKVLGPSQGLHPCLFSLRFGFNLGNGCRGRVLCALSTGLARSLSFHR